MITKCEGFFPFFKFLSSDQNLGNCSVCHNSLVYTVDFLKNLTFFKLCSKDLIYLLVEKISDNCDKCKGFSYFEVLKFVTKFR